MGNTMMSYAYIAMTVIFTVYGQVIVKWQAGQAGALPPAAGDKILFLLRLVFCNLWILSGLIAAFFASLAWIAAMTKFPLSHAYPFVSFSFVLVMLSGAIFFQEPLSMPKIVGMICIVSGIVIGSQG